MGLENFFKKMFGGLKDKNTFNVYLQDEKCGRKIKVLLRKSYDIQRVYEEDKNADYMVNKVIICDRCFNRIEIKIKFDRRYKIILQEIKRGKFLTEEEYNIKEER